MKQNVIRICPKPQFSLSPYLYMQFMEPLSNTDSSVDAAWDYVNQRWQPKVIDAVKYLAPTMVRWGGCFSSYYRWKEAVGPRSQRVPMLNLCWDGIFSNQVGTREFVHFCKHIGAEPLIGVNMESDGRKHWAYPLPGVCRSAGAEEAAEWVDYCNNPDNAMRKAHGDVDPYPVKYWQIGNETSYDPNGFDCETAARITLNFARQMRAVDPSIKLIAWGDSGWAGRMCEIAGEEVDMIAFHHHFNSGLENSPLYGTEYRRDFAKTWEHLMHAYRSMEEHIQSMREQVAPYGKKLAMTEGHFALPGRNRCEVLSTWAAGVAYARMLNVQERNGDILEIATLADFFGNRWQVNAIIIPTPIRKLKPYLQPVGWVMMLYRRHVGKEAISVDYPSDLDVVASRTGNRIYLHVVNTQMERGIKVNLEVDGMKIIRGKAYEIAEDPEFEITELTPDAFKPFEKELTGSEWYFPAASVTAIELECEA